ncbi:hypothetical protein A2U01_0118547, partial [Trifolium medium]|nr:hypothetical protein [Trifolium medium]
ARTFLMQESNCLARRAILPAQRADDRSSPFPQPCWRDAPSLPARRAID